MIGPVKADPQQALPVNVETPTKAGTEIRVARTKAGTVTGRAPIRAETVTGKAPIREGSRAAMRKVGRAGASDVTMIDSVAPVQEAEGAVAVAVAVRGGRGGARALAVVEAVVLTAAVVVARAVVATTDALNTRPL